MKEAHGTGDGALVGKELGQPGLSSPAENKQGQRQMGRRLRGGLPWAFFFSLEDVSCWLPHPHPPFTPVPNSSLARMGQNQRGL